MNQLATLLMDMRGFYPATTAHGQVTPSGELIETEDIVFDLHPLSVQVVRVKVVKDIMPPFIFVEAE